jgi:hypothetical protein
MTLNISNGDCPPLLPPMMANCSGIGVCVSSTYCACPEGFTGRGDFAYNSPSCTMHVRTIQGLYSFWAFVNFGAVIFALYYLMKKLQQRKHVYEFRDLSPFVLGVCSLASFSFMGTSGAIRAAFPDTQTIGTNAAVTVCYFLGVWAFWMAIHAFAYGFLKLIYLQTQVFSSWDTKQKLLVELQKLLTTTAFLASCTCFIPLGMLAQPSTETFFIFGAFHFLGIAVLTLGCGIFIPRFCQRLEVAIESVLNHSENIKTGNNNLNRVLGRLRRFRKWVILIAFGTLPGAVLMG